VKTAKNSCGQKYRKITQRRLADVDNCQESQAVRSRRADQRSVARHLSPVAVASSGHRAMVSLGNTAQFARRTKKLSSCEDDAHMFIRQIGMA
jgi:hypothetical protein